MAGVRLAENSSRSLLKSMAIIGSAQAVRILITIVRAKLVAILLGPTGIGLLSMFNNLHEMASMSAGLGLGTSGVREISGAKGEEVTLSRVRRVLFGALVLQGLVAMVAIWLTRDMLALWLLDSTDHSFEVGLVGVAVFLFLVAGSQTALLQGMRRIGDLGRVTVLSTLFGSASGLLAVWLLGLSGLIWLILLIQGGRRAGICREVSTQIWGNYLSRCGQGRPGEGSLECVL